MKSNRFPPIRKPLSLLLALLLCIGLILPTAALASAPPSELPFSLSAGAVTNYEASGYCFSSMVYAPDDPNADTWGYIYPQESVDLYTVSLPYGTQALTLSFSEDRLAYGYDGSGGYLNSCAADEENGYGNNGQAGETAANIRLVDDRFASYIRIQTPYDTNWSSTTLYAVKFEYTTENAAQECAMNLKWSDLSTEPANAVTQKLTLPDTDPNTGAAISWSSSNPAVLTDDGTVVRPAYGQADADITLTATASKETDSAHRTFSVRVPAEGVAEYADKNLNGLLSTIAASYTESSEEWVILDMATYAKTRPNAVSKTSAGARQTYINNTIKALQKGGLCDTDYDKAILSLTALGVDVTGLYPVNSNTPINAVSLLNGVTHSASAWSAPNTLAAYAQGDYETDAYEAALLTAVLEKQQTDGSWSEWGTIDTTANMLAALSLYRDRAGVQDAIEKAVDFLSKQQKDTGVYDDGQTGGWAAGSNANSTAMVIIGLAANGINPATDTRFVKDGHSALDGLLSFALSDDSGFGYKDSVAKNALATEQGFRALVAAAQVLQTGQAYNVYDFHDTAVSPVHATGSGRVHRPTSSTGDTIQVTVTIKADTGYWMRNQSISIPGTDATVYHALRAALEASGISQSGGEDGYVYAMTKDGKTLAEFSSGANSGWLYKVNGELPAVGLTSCEIQNGDSIVWYYTEDWTKDPSAGSMGRKPGKKPTGSTVSTPSADSGDESTAPSSEKAFPFTDIAPDAFFYPAAVWAVANGIANGISDTAFCPAQTCTRGQTVTFLWRAAGCPEPKSTAQPFADVEETAYYSKAVLWAAEAGITNGVSDTAFCPAATVSRGQAVTLLCRLAGGGNSGGDVPFSDIDRTAYYGDAVQWVVETGVANGTSDTTFSPEAGCTRGQLVTLLYRCLGA